MANERADKATETKPWHRQRGEDGELEPLLWWARFVAYRNIGPSRSLLGCVNQERVTKGNERSDYTPGSWRRAFKKWNWAERVEAWDEHNRQRAEIEWADRRKQIKNREWKQAEKLLERVEKMLGYPLSEVIQEDAEGRVFKVQPVRWRQSDITRFLETASKLARLAAEMETERHRQEITGKDDKPLFEDVAKPLEQIASRIDSVAALLRGAEGVPSPDSADAEGAEAP